MDVHQSDKTCTLNITTKIPTANCVPMYITRKCNLLVRKQKDYYKILIIAVNEFKYIGSFVRTIKASYFILVNWVV